MKTATKKTSYIIAVALILSAIGIYLLSTFTNVERGYSAAQVAAGEAVFTKNCLVCHGVNGEGTANWQKPNADGTYPPPPLNGTAHTWHHPFSVLKQTIKKGGVPLGGQMPAFEDTLSDEEIENVIFYVQSQWSDKIYQTWLIKVEAPN
ncbi:MAG: cytochrome c [Proteobacteria bacterium]|nr:cytochrome c [Pseudomonadota bacterium]